MTCILALLPVLLQTGDRTVLTWEGTAYTGRVHAEGDLWVVRTLGGIHRLPADDVACVFDSPREPVRRAESDFEDAKRLYEQAKDLPDRDPVRNRKLQAAVQTAQRAARVLRLMDAHLPAADRNGTARTVQKMMLFMRLCRGGMSSERAAGPAAPEPDRPVPLAEVHFGFEPPETAPGPGDPAPVEFGPGQGALAAALEHPDPERRAGAVTRLTHPPAPLQVPALLDLLERESDPRVLEALSEGLGLIDAAAHLDRLAAVWKEAGPRKRSIVLALARTARPDRALDVLVEWFTESPPEEDAERARFAGSFRALRDGAGGRLKTALNRTRDRKLQRELLMQLAALRDPDLAPALVKAIPAFPSVAVNGLLLIGRPAIPAILKGFSTADQDVRKWSSWLCQQLTGIRRINASHFEEWWTKNRRKVADEEARWWAAQEAGGYPVDARVFARLVRRR